MGNLRESFRIKSHLGKSGLFLVCLCIVVGALLFGCSSTPDMKGVQDVELFPVEFDAPQEMMILPGDKVSVKFYATPELNELKQIVRPDGKISLQLVGDVELVGKSPEKVRQELIGLYKRELVDPQITVIIDEYVGRKVYVGGEVEKSQMIEMPGRLTALEAILQAGGFKLDTAEPSNVVLIRQIDGVRYGKSIDLSGALDGERYVPFLLKPCDIVYVPETSISAVTRWIDNHINKIIPLGLRWTKTTGNVTYGLDTYGR